jgi:Raf kinase inhibitor-like YbhB/YbcL family protein
MMSIAVIPLLLTQDIRKNVTGKTESSMILSSDAFQNGGQIPPVHTCKGQGISPQLAWRNVPPGVKSFALIVEDPDSPGGTFGHWVLYNIPGEKRELPSSVPPSSSLPDGTRQGMNDFRKIGYGGPCPPPGRPHRYYFRIFALRVTFLPSATMDRAALLLAMKDQMITTAELMGFFSR